MLAATGDHPFERVDAVLADVGLTEAADRRVGGYSMGMRQRLGIAAALLGDPEVLILDEPTNGLDPPGIVWMRDLVREQAARGRAVLVSSHLLAEVAQSVDDVVVISRGEMRGHGTLESVLGGDEGLVTAVRAQDNVRLARALEAAGHTAQRSGNGLLVPGASPEEVGVVAGDAGVYLVAPGASDALARAGVPRADRGRGAAVSPLLRAELLKLRTTRTFVALVGVALALSLLVVVLTDAAQRRASTPERRARPLLRRLHGPVHHAARRDRDGRRMAPPDDHRHRPRRAQPAAPDEREDARLRRGRRRAVADRDGRRSCSSARSSCPRAASTPSRSRTCSTSCGATCSSPRCVGALGVGIGALIRNQIVAIIGVLILGFVVEPALFGLAPDVGRFGPTAGRAGRHQGHRPVRRRRGPTSSRRARAMLVMLGWIALFFAAAGVRLQRRDLV